MKAGWIALVAVGTVAVAAWTVTIGQVTGRGGQTNTAARATSAPLVPTPARPALKPRPTPTPSPTALAEAAQPTPSPYVVHRVLDVREPMRHGDWYWDETGAPPGEVVITVDLAAQVLSAFRGGYEIGTAVILYGADAKPTPLGVHPVLMKDADHRSSTYGNAPMPYTLRLTGDGVAIHGTTVQDGYMTHGCIGVPTPFAKRLFGVVPVGTKVIVTRGETLHVGGAIDAA